MIYKIRGITPQKIHSKQKLKFALIWVYTPLSYIIVLLLNSMNWMFFWSFIAPFLIYYLFSFTQSKTILNIAPTSSTEKPVEIAIDKIQALVLKRAVYRTYKLFSLQRKKTLYIVIDMLTIVSDSADRSIGFLRNLTQEESVAFEKTLLPDNTILYTEYYNSFPAPEAILVEKDEFDILCRKLSEFSGKPITKLSGGNLSY
jgi:hypothetical protein